MNENASLKNKKSTEIQLASASGQPVTKNSRISKYKMQDDTTSSQPVFASPEEIAISKGHRIFTQIPKFENNGKRDLWAFNKWKEIGALNLKKLVRDGYLFIETNEVEDTRATELARLHAQPHKENESKISKKMKMTYPFRFDY